MQDYPHIEDMTFQDFPEYVLPIFQGLMGFWILLLQSFLLSDEEQSF